MQKRIQQIFLNELKEKVVNVKDVSKGVDQIVKIVETEKSKYIIKFPRKCIPELLMREYLACQKLQNLIPVPKCIAKSDEYIIEEFITGADLDDISLSLDEKQKIYKELGAILKKIHSIPMKGYGFIEVNGNGEYSSLKQRVLEDRDTNLSYIKKNFLSKVDYTKLTKYLKQNDFYSESRESVLLHFDFEDWNIKVDNGRIVGILDFGDLSSGPPAYDLARVFISHNRDEFFNYFLKGYGNIDLNEVKYYVIISLLWMIPYHNEKKNMKELENGIRILKEII